MVDTALAQQTQLDVEPADMTPAGDEEESLFERYSLMGSAIITGVALVLGWGLGWLGVIDGNVQIAFYVVAYLAGGTFAAIEATRSLWDRRIEIDLLMVAAAIGAATIGHWVEGAILLFLFSLGNALEHYAMGRTTSAVRKLMELSPEEATVLRDGNEEVVHVSELVIGDTVLVRPGERIAADGDVIRGDSSIDQSAITGESIPVHKWPGDPVFTGTINGQGALRIRVTRLAHESTLAKIIRIVQSAQDDKSETQRFTDRFEGTYAGLVILSSFLYLVGLVVIGGMDFYDAFYRSMILLVVASPCALVISTPASTLSALANAARNGILIKGAAQLENVGTVKAVAFDKTGTMTIGEPRLTDLRPAPGISTDELLTIAASAERTSEHPLAEAIVAAARSRDLRLQESQDLTAVVGQGISVHVDTDTVLIGNETLFESKGIELPAASLREANQLREDGKTTMYVVSVQPDSGVKVLGVIGVADTIRPVAADVIRQLHEMGVEKTVMLTGDNERAALSIGRQTGIDEIHAGLLPEEKVKVVEQLKKEYGDVIMVGDGVNDAPALATASIGVAMGAAGSDVALETADIVLMGDDLTRLPYVVELSRKTRRIIRQNLTFALSVIVLLVIGTLAGVTTLPLGVVGHEGSTIIVVANGLRLLGGVKMPGLSRPEPLSKPVLQPAAD